MAKAKIMRVKGWKPIKGSHNFWITKGAVVGIELSPKGWEVIGRKNYANYNKTLKVVKESGGTGFRKAKDFAIKWAKKVNSDGKK